MTEDEQKQWKKSQIDSFTDEKIPLADDFPVFMFPYSVSRSPIRNLHSHDVLELGLCLKGTGIFIIDNCIQTYEAGDVIIIGPGIYHRAKSGASMEDLWHFIYFRPADWEAKSITPSMSRLIDNSEDPHLFLLMTLLSDEIKELKQDCKTGIKGLIQTILVRISRLGHNAGKENSMHNLFPTGVDQRINNAIDLLLNSDTQPHNITALAEKCNMSESHFRRLFKEQVGMSPKHFQIKLQIKTAMIKLKDKNMRVVDISEESGFDSLSSFNRHFKNETGLSPLQWRSHQSQS